MTERDLRLDGLRGLATIAVVVSHFFAEVPSGIAGLAVGFFGVGIFFVLSGFLIGRLILERSSSANFYRIFYARRFLRTLPSYAVVLAFIMVATYLGGRSWIPGLGDIPAWSYVTFTQNLFMAGQAQIGSEWLGPTWTLAVEEQFYLIAPLAIIWTPKKYLVAVIALVTLVCIGYRFYGAFHGRPPLSYLFTLLGNADALALGIGAAVLQRRMTPSRLIDRLLEVLPLACLMLILILKSLLPEQLPIAPFMRPLVALASAAYILRIATNAAVCGWLRGKFLCVVGHNSYSIYLVHMPVAGLVHGVITGSHPDIGSGVQIAATLASVAATAAVAFLLTKTVEDRAIDYGRRLRWAPAEPSDPQQPHPGEAAAAVATAR